MAAANTHLLQVLLGGCSPALVKQLRPGAEACTTLMLMGVAWQMLRWCMLMCVAWSVHCRPVACMSVVPATRHSTLRLPSHTPYTCPALRVVLLLLPD